jgi:hypothetical protein
MSNTRTAKPGAALRQERYASSPDLDRGLAANLVAARCGVLEKAEDRETVWFLQRLSHTRGGLSSVAKELLAQFVDKLGTPSMRKFGMKPGQIYNAQQVKIIRKEIDASGPELPLCGDLRMTPEDLLDDCEKADDYQPPNSYALGAILDRNEIEKSLPKYLEKLCLDPANDFKGPWYFPDLIECVRELQSARAEDNSKTVTTEIGALINEELDYAHESKCMVLIDGLARIGKTFAAKTWCEQRGGRVRYVQVPSTNDDTGFFRAIAKALGISSGLAWKAVQLRDRIEDVLQRGDLMIVFDEAHYLWPISSYRYAVPARVNWIMTALVNYGVPVALVTTPQFLQTQKFIEQRTNWTSEQFIGRIGKYKKLPDSLNERDLQKVAGSLLPEGDEKSIEMLVRYAQSSKKYLAAIEAAVRRARYLATKGGRATANRTDVKKAITESAIPSDTALVEAMTQPSKTRGRGKNGSLQGHFKSTETVFEADRDPRSPEEISAPSRINFAHVASEPVSG